MLFFTPLTLWLALFDPVQDCGCFGDAIILTNWQTFYKNIVILIFAFISFGYRNKFKSWLKVKTEWLITALLVVIVTLFSYYNLEHLPIIDFRPYKVGVHIPDKMIIPEDAPVDEYEQYFTLLNTVSGKQTSIESEIYMSDSTYWGSESEWEYVSSTEPQLIKKGYQPPIHDFTITSLDGDDITDDVLADESYDFILVTYDLKKTRTAKLSMINTIYEQAINDDFKFICLTSVSTEEILMFKNTHNIPYDFYIMDPITLKTIVRANPGLLLLHEGTIVAKWHSNDIPEYTEIKQKYMKHE